MGMDIGGAETHILELAKELKRRKHEVYVVSNGGKYVEELEKYNIMHIWAPLNNKKPWNMIKSYNIIRDFIKQKDIEIVHSHSRISSYICGLLHKKYKFKYITTAHWTFKVTPLLKKMTNWGEITIAVSDDIKDYLIKNYNILEKNIIVTVNGIDTKKFKDNIEYEDIKKEFHLKDTINRIVYISRLDESRALVAKQLINIAPKLEKQIKDLEIIIVGGGDSFEELNQMAQNINNKLGKNLIIMTNSRTDVNKFASIGKIFIGVSRSALEAMSAKRPTIIAGNEGYIGIFDETKLNDSIETNFCCRGFSLSTEDNLYNDIIKLNSLDSKELIKQGKYNREIVEKYYSINKMVDDCELAYKLCNKNI